MPNWIFDLDYTLYQQQCSRFNYNELSHCIDMNNKIKKLQGKKILFTNGNLLHTLRCIKLMKLEGIFHKVLCREITGFKPDITSYIKLYHQANISIKEPCIFFEDTIENLIQSKRFNWTTVLIGNYKEDIKQRHPQIDYIFADINLALDFFLDVKK